MVAGCKGQDRMPHPNKMIPEYERIIKEYMTAVTDIPYRACRHAYDIMDYTMHMNLILIDMEEEEGTEIKEVFSPGPHGGHLRDRLVGSGGSCDCR